MNRNPFNYKDRHIAVLVRKHGANNVVVNPRTGVGMTRSTWDYLISVDPKLNKLVKAGVIKPVPANKWFIQQEMAIVSNNRAKLRPYRQHNQQPKPQSSLAA